MIVCNIRTLRASITGVQRYTLEILKRLPGTIQTVEPPRSMSAQWGHLWEQTVLPLRARGHLLWSPAGTGPVALANQIVTVHDIAPLDCPEGYSPAFRRWYAYLWRHLLPRVRGLISVSEFTKRRLIEEFGLPADSIHVTPLGVDHARFFAQSEDKVEALDTLAEALDRDRTYLLNEAVVAYLEVQRWHIEQIERGIRQADAGKLVDHDKVKKVIAGWRR